jgi:hypothetical protein
MENVFLKNRKDTGFHARNHGFEVGIAGTILRINSNDTP